MVSSHTAVPKFPTAGASETTPSRAQYFSWINNTNEGSTEEQTLINLDFFKWLRDEYGMQIDIYALDAGNLDGCGFYGSTDSARYKRQFPRGWKPIVDKARSIGTRLGIWGGPDGFGDTASDAQRRIDTMVGTCRAYNFALFKFDAVCGGLRKEKQDAFVRMMKSCRKYSPDLILLNHRLELGKGMPHATTFLWEGLETYIDVHLANSSTATHHRAGAMGRGLPPELKRLTEDHGVCLSSCLDYWEDDLILQAFNRCLILAPEIYANPWLLRDDEFPRLARIYNLHRRYRDILVKGIVLPEKHYGPSAVSRGDATTRLITLRNLNWTPVVYNVKLDASIGLSARRRSPIEVRQFHPTEKIIGSFGQGSTVSIEVAPFRSCLLLATTAQCNEIGINGCDYEVVRDVPRKPIIIKLLGMPGEKRSVSLNLPSDRTFTCAELDGRAVHELTRGKTLEVTFGGKKLRRPFHRKLGVLKSCPVPPDAESLYEATCFAADNNALEIRELLRSGLTKIPQVQRARDAFFKHDLFVKRGLWDRNMFDDDPDTAFYICRRWGRSAAIEGGCLRLDFGSRIMIDRLIIRSPTEETLQPCKSEEAVWGSISADLRTWKPIVFMAGAITEARIAHPIPVRYLRLPQSPGYVSEIEGYCKGRKLDRSSWRASNLFAPWWNVRAEKAWSTTFILDEATPGSYLCIALNGAHGVEGAYAAIRVSGRPVGAPDRSPSFPANVWESPVRSVDRNYTYYIPVTPEMVGKRIDAVVLGMRGGSAGFKPEVWVTAYPAPFASKELVLIAMPRLVTSPRLFPVSKPDSEAEGFVIPRRTTGWARGR